MKVLVVHNPAADLASPDNADVLVQARAVAEALEVLGHDVAVQAWPEDMDAAREAIQNDCPDTVFNLVESIRGSARTVHEVPALLAGMKMPCTGAAAGPLLSSTNKLLAKAVLVEHGLPTPAWLDAQGRGTAAPPGRFIVKSVWEHASFGLDEDNVVHGSSQARLLAQMRKRSQTLGGDWFAEEYIPGREFNIAVIQEQGQPRVLAPAEIVFHGYAQEKHRVVGFRAKWQEHSLEYRNTRRKQDFCETDAGLLNTVVHTAEQCWRAFALSGYARVDLRVDAKNRPWIIDVNANPCLSPDAGFQAACSASGLPFPEVVDLLLRAAQ